MNFKTFLYLLFIFVVIAAVAMLAYANHHNVTIQYPFVRDITLPAWAVVFLSFILGLGVAILWFLWRSSVLMFDRWRRKKTTRREKKLDDVFLRTQQLLRSGEDEAAKRGLKEILAKDANHLNALKCLGDLYRKEGDGAEASRLHQRALAVNERDPEIYLALAEDHEQRGEHEMAREYLCRADSELGGGYFIKKKLQNFYLAQKAWEEARSNQHGILGLPLSGDILALEKEILCGIHLEMALSRREQGDLKRARSELKKIIKDNPKFAPAYQVFSEIYLDGGDDPRALEEMERGYDATGLPFFLKMIEDYHFAHEAPDQAIDAYKRALSKLKQLDKEPILRFLLGSLYFRLEMIDEALQEYMKIATEVQECDARIQFLGAGIYARKQDYRAAYEKLKEYFEIYPLWRQNYQCAVCSTCHEEWIPRCTACHSWNSLVFRRFEPVKEPDEAGMVSSMPVYTPKSN